MSSNLNVNISANISEFRKSIKEAQSQIKSLSDQQQKLIGITNEDVAAFDRAAKSLDRAANGTKTTASASKLLEKELKELRILFDSLSDSAKASDFGKTLSTQISNVENKLNSLRTALSNTQSGSSKFNELLSSINPTLGKLSSALSDGANAGSVLGGVLGGATTAGIMLAADAAKELLSALKETIQRSIEVAKTYSEAQTEMIKYANLSQQEANATTTALKAIDTTTATDELMRLVSVGGRLGVAKESLVDFAEGANMLKSALGADLGQDNLDRLYKSVQAFGLADTMGWKDGVLAIGSAINELGQTTSANERDISEYISRLNALGAAGTLTAQQVVALGARFSEAGMTMEQAATATSGIIQRMTTNTADFAQVANMTTTAFTELVNKSPYEALLAVADGMRGLSETEVGETLSQLGVTGAGVSATMKLLSADTERLTSYLNTATEQFKTAASINNEYSASQNSVTGQMERQNKVFNDSLDTMGSSMLPLLVDLRETVVNLSVVFSDAWSSMMDAIESTGISDALTGLFEILGEIVSVVINLSSTAFKLISVLGSCTTQEEATYSATQSFADALHTLNDYIKALNDWLSKVQHKIREFKEALGLTKKSTEEFSNAITEANKSGNSFTLNKVRSEADSTGKHIDALSDKVTSLKNNIGSLSNTKGSVADRILKGQNVLGNPISGTIAQMDKGVSKTSTHSNSTRTNSHTTTASNTPKSRTYKSKSGKSKVTVQSMSDEKLEIALKAGKATDTEIATAFKRAFNGSTKFDKLLRSYFGDSLDGLHSYYTERLKALESERGDISKNESKYTASQFQQLISKNATDRTQVENELKQIRLLSDLTDKMDKGDTISAKELISLKSIEPFSDSIRELMGELISKVNTGYSLSSKLNSDIDTLHYTAIGEISDKEERKNIYGLYQSYHKDIDTLKSSIQQWSKTGISVKEKQQSEVLFTSAANKYADFITQIITSTRLTDTERRDLLVVIRKTIEKDISAYILHADKNRASMTPAQLQQWSKLEQIMGRKKGYDSNGKETYELDTSKYVNLQMKQLLTPSAMTPEEIRYLAQIKDISRKTGNVYMSGGGLTQEAIQTAIYDKLPRVGVGAVRIGDLFNRAINLSDEINKLDVGMAKDSFNSFTKLTSSITGLAATFDGIGDRWKKAKWYEKINTVVNAIQQLYSLYNLGADIVGKVKDYIDTKDKAKNKLAQSQSILVQEETQQQQYISDTAAGLIKIPNQRQSVSLSDAIGGYGVVQSKATTFQPFEYDSNQMFSSLSSALSQFKSNIESATSVISGYTNAITGSGSSSSGAGPSVVNNTNTGQNSVQVSGADAGYSNQLVSGGSPSGGVDAFSGTAASISATGQAMKNFGQISAATSKTSADAAKKQEQANKTAAAASIAMSLASGVEAVGELVKAGSKQPGGVFVKIAATLAALAAGAGIVAGIISLSKKHAQGGITEGGSIGSVGGMIMGGTTVGDYNIARVNGGEMILNGTQQSRLFSMLNGGGGGSVGDNNNMSGSVRFEISGDKLVGVLNNHNKLKQF